MDDFVLNRPRCPPSSCPFRSVFWDFSKEYNWSNLLPLQRGVKTPHDVGNYGNERGGENACVMNLRARARFDVKYHTKPTLSRRALSYRRGSLYVCQLT